MYNSSNVVEAIHPPLFRGDVVLVGGGDTRVSPVIRLTNINSTVVASFWFVLGVNKKTCLFLGIKISKNKNTRKNKGLITSLEGTFVTS